MLIISTLYEEFMMADKTDVAQMEQIGQITFLRTNDLARTLKRVDKEVDKAVAFLAAIILDEKQDIKVRMSAATFIVDTKVKLSAEISKDNLQRTIAECKRLGGMKQISPRNVGNEDPAEDGEEFENDLPPIVDFSMVRKA